MTNRAEHARLEGVVREYLDVVYGSALRQVRDPHVAADVTQAVFLVLQRKIGGLEEGPKMTVWLLRATRYACMDVRKQERRRMYHEMRAAAMKSQRENRTKVREMEGVVDAALDRLPVEDRRLIVAVYVEGLSHKELALQLCIGEAAAQKRVQRAMGKLKRVLERAGVAYTVAGAEGSLTAMGKPAAAPAAIMPAVLMVLGGEVPGAVEAIAVGIARTWRRVKVKVALALLAVAGLVWLGAHAVVVEPKLQPKLGPIATEASGQAFDPGVFRALEDGQRVDFVLAALDARDRGLQNLRFEQRDRSEEINLNNGERTLKASDFFEFRRLGQTLWIHAITSRIGRPETTAQEAYVNWDGQTFHSLIVPPYSGSAEAAGVVGMTEPNTFSRSRYEELLGIRVTDNVYDDFRGTVADWIREQRRAGKMMVVSLSEDAASPLDIRAFEVKNPSSLVSKQFFMDPARGYAIVRVVETVETSKFQTRATTTLEASVLKRVGKVWIPTQARAVYEASTKPNVKAEVSYEISKLTLGGETGADVEVTFPAGTHVLDRVRGVAYGVNGDGTFHLEPLAYSAAGTVMLPPTDTRVDRVDAKATQGYRVIPLVQP